MKKENFKEMRKQESVASSEVVFEDFLIEYYTNILRELKERDNNEFKKKLVIKLLQKNLFLLRRLADPGFYTFICREILKDKKFLTIALQFTKKEIVLKLMKNDFFQDPFSKIEDWSFYNIPNITPGLPIADNTGKIRNYNEFFIEYFKDQIKLAKVDGNLERIKAIEVVMKDYSTYKYGIHELLVNPFSSEPFTLNFIKKYEINLKNQKVKFGGLYEHINPNFIRSNFFILQTYEYQKIILKVTKLISDILEIPQEQAILLNKFINDIIAVIHFKWFDLKNEEEKWELLGLEHKFALSVKDFEKIHEIHMFINRSILNHDLVEKYIEQIYGVTKQSDSELKDEQLLNDGLSDKMTQDLEKEERLLLYVITSLQQKGYFSNALNGWKFLLTLKISKETNFICLKNMGILHQKLGDYQNAVNSFKQSILTIKNEYPYHRGLINRNLGVSYHFLGKLDLKRSHFRKVEEITNNLNETDKYSLLINLAGGLETTNDFKEACDLILKITSSDVRNDRIYDLAFNKFQIYEESRNNNQALDNKRLSTSLVTMDIKTIKNYYHLHKRNFQFTEAKKALERALKMAKQNNATGQINLILEELAELFILTKNKKEFMDLFSNLDFEGIFPKFEIFKAVYFILNGNKGEGMEIFKKFYKNYFEIDCVSFTINLSPKYNLNNVKQDVMPVLWFIKPLIDFSYNQINELIDDMIECLDSKDDIGGLLIDIGRVCDQAVDMEHSIIYYEKALQFIPSNINVRIICLYDIAGAYINLDEFKKAETYISEIMQYFQDETNRDIIKPIVAEVTLVGISEFYSYYYDFPNAIKYVRKAKSYSNNPKLELLEQEFVGLNEKFLFYNAIDEKEIKSLLYYSDLIFNKVSEVSLEMDYSIIIFSYCKAIEILLDKKITKSIDLSDILEPFYEGVNRKKIRDDIWKILPRVLKAILSTNTPKSISIGQWPYVLKDISRKGKFRTSKPIYFEFLIRLEKLIDEENRKMIVKSCLNLVEYRNQSVHTKFHSKEEFLDEKPRIVSNVNNILSLFQ